MKTDRIELAYILSAKDRVHTQNMLNHLSLIRENSALSWIASPRVA